MVEGVLGHDGAPSVSASRCHLPQEGRIGKQCSFRQVTVQPSLAGAHQFGSPGIEIGEVIAQRF